MVAEAMRAQLAAAIGTDLSAVSGSEIGDAIEYFASPNTALWIGAPLTWRFRPYGNDADRCMFDEDYSAAPKSGGLCAVLNQDLFNLAWARHGLKSMTKPAVTLTGYQEIRIRQFHQDLDAYLQA
ncbi:hypothetical protein C1Y40_03232 [Mycobacterium talmoniae]|uniref:Uncharacterized protein n=1 Tax=Mycobacterium talmoniae TaxID=1858794 RepID=A0A2S8BIT9_9MYCO|nr:hypothetical protein C1Y40_03232 [Mycobacterium talmoniae]